MPNAQAEAIQSFHKVTLGQPNMSTSTIPANPNRNIATKMGEKCEVAVFPKTHPAPKTSDMIRARAKCGRDIRVRIQFEILDARCIAAQGTQPHKIRGTLRLCECISPRSRHWLCCREMWQNLRTRLWVFSGR